MTDLPIKNATDERDQPAPFKIEISNGISFGFLSAIGFWFFTLIFVIFVLLVLWAFGFQFASAPI